MTRLNSRVFLWVIVIGTGAKIPGGIWTAIGLIYLAVKTKGFKELPPEMTFDESFFMICSTKGYYDTFDKGFAILYNWIDANGYKIAGKARISAINGPWDTKNPDDYVNELQVPVIKK